MEGSAGKRKRATLPEQALRTMAPMDVQQRLLESPARVLMRLSRGLIVDADALAELERRIGCPEAVVG